MELLDYLTQNKITMQKFGERIGRAQSIVSRLANKKHWPDRGTAVKIVHATKGMVTLDELYSLPPRLRNQRTGH